jgi:hypothetical protein
MRQKLSMAIMALVCAATIPCAFGLSRDLPRPEIYFPKNYDMSRAEQVHAVLRSDQFKYRGGLVSYWEPQWSTTLVFDGNARSLSSFLEQLNAIRGMQVQLTFSPDLSKETGSALVAGSWWVKYSHTAPNTITVRINLAAETLGGDRFKLVLPKTKP